MNDFEDMAKSLRQQMAYFVVAVDTKVDVVHDGRYVAVAVAVAVVVVVEVYVVVLIHWQTGLEEVCYHNLVVARRVDHAVNIHLYMHDHFH